MALLKILFKPDVHTVYQSKAFCLLCDLNMIYKEYKIVLIHKKSQKI